jgi:hypothetical protein
MRRQSALKQAVKSVSGAPQEVVVSYAEEDRGAAQALVTYLRGRGIGVWWDGDLLTGQDFHDTIRCALLDAKAVIVIWSQASAKSSWVRDEAGLAAAHDKLVTTHVPDFDRRLMPLGYGQYQCDSVEDRERIIRALGRFGIEART